MLMHTRIVSMVLGAALIAGCEQAEPPKPNPLRSVKTQLIESAAASSSRVFNGVSQSEQSANLSFKVAGSITEMNVAIGDSVEQGATLAILDSKPFQLELERANAESSRVRAEARNAESNYQRIRNLYANQSASRTELDTARAGAESATALQSAAARAVQIARLNLSYTNLEAPSNCVVAEKMADVGENVSAGQQVMTLNCGDKIEVELSIPESQINLFSAGMTGITSFDSIADVAFPSSVIEVGQVARGTTFPVTVEINEPEGLRAGLAAQVTFEFANTENSLIVPSAAVMEDQNGRFVFILSAVEGANTGVVERVAVQVGDIHSDGITITDGLQPGQRVITAGTSVIRDGLEVLAR